MMKKSVIISLIIIAAACTDKTGSDEFKLSGRLLSDESAGTDSPTEQLLLSKGSNTDTIDIKPDGSFNFTGSADVPGDYYLRLEKGVIPVYLAPGKELEVSVDPENTEITSFSGSLADENKFIKKANEMGKENSAFVRKYYEVPAEDYLRGMDSLRKAEDKFLEDFIQNNPGLSEEFVESRRILNKFSYYSSLLNYENIHSYYTGDETVELPEGWYDFLNDIDIDRPEYLNVPVSLSVINTIINKKIEEKSGLGDEAWGTAELLKKQFDYIIDNFENQDLINHFLYTNLSSYIDSRGTGGVEDLTETFYSHSTNEKHINSIKEKEKEWAPLKTGMQAPAFTLPDINGDMVSLSDFRGKYVYIDFWATWCGPCKIEIPYLEQLAEEYKDKNIEIISISVDKDKQAWKDMVTKDQPQWLQLHDSILLNDKYLVKYIPSFVLIDREGKILEARALRPSTGEELTKQLNNLEGI